MISAQRPKVDQDHPDQSILFPVLLACMLAMFLVKSFTHSDWITRVFYSIVIIGPVIQVRKNRWLLAIGLVITVPASVMSAIDIAYDDGGNLSMVVSLLYLAAFTFTAVVMLRRVLSHRKVTTATVSGALCVYLLMGIMWTMSYHLLEKDIEPRDQPFNGIDKAQVYRNAAHDLLQLEIIAPTKDFEQELEALIVFDTQSDEGSQSKLPRKTKLHIRREAYSQIDGRLFYFSFVTLTTLGYGDISPRSDKARSLALLEAICGQMFLAVLIARLVGLHIAMRTLADRS